MPSSTTSDWNSSLEGNGTLRINKGKVVIDGGLRVWDTGTVELGGVGGGNNDAQLDAIGLRLRNINSLSHTDGTLTVSGGTFDPGAAGYMIDGAAADDRPKLVLDNATSTTITACAMALFTSLAHMAFPTGPRW